METPQIISRADARALGLTHYFTGKPCRNGHICERQVIGRRCRECARNCARARRAANPEKFREQDRAHREKHRDQRRAQRRAYNAAHREQRRAYDAAHPKTRREWRAANPETARERHRKKNYGLTPEHFAAILEGQKGCCAICLCDLAALPPHHVHTDHDHATGIVRGILCRDCNRGLGSFKDDPDSLARAIEYVREFRELGKIVEPSPYRERANKESTRKKRRLMAASAVGQG